MKVSIQIPLLVILTWLINIVNLTFLCQIIPIATCILTYTQKQIQPNKIELKNRVEIFNAEVREQTYNGLLQVKDQIISDPSSLWPMLGESLLEEASGNSTTAWEEANNENTDWGKRRHIYAKGTVRTASSIFFSGKLVLKLPEIAEDLILKMGRAKGRFKFKDVAEATDALQENLDQLLDKIKLLPDEGKKFLDDFAEAETDVLEQFLLNPELVEAWKKMDQLGADEALRRNPGALEVLDLKAKNQLNDIPDPSTYLDADYIANHLAKFNDGGSRIVLKETYIKRGVGKPDEGMTEFISTKSEIDHILTLSVAEQAEKLGLSVDEINGGLVRINFNLSNKIEMPSGKRFWSKIFAKKFK